MSEFGEQWLDAIVGAVTVAAGSLWLRLWAESLDGRPDVPVEHLGWIDISSEGLHRRALEEILVRLPAPELVAAGGLDDVTVPSFGEGDEEWIDAAAEFLVLTGRLAGAGRRVLSEASSDRVEAVFEEDFEAAATAGIRLEAVLAGTSDETSRLWRACLAAIEGRC